jgi:hypothetical protein
MKHSVPARRATREGGAGRPEPMRSTVSDDDIGWPKK